VNFQRLKIKKALTTSAFFIGWLLCAPLQANSFIQPKPDCKEFIATETATVRYVHDGDTLFLSDKRKLRLIGIDTPELARDHKNTVSAEQPFAREARDFVRRLISQYGHQISLMPGVEKTDRYQRWLFHIRLSDGSLLQSRLLQAGLAVAYTTPPNQLLSNCYQQAEHVAQQQNKNIWSAPKYQAIAAEKLQAKHRGFHIIKGKVRHIGESKKAIWLNFYGNFSARIDKRDQRYFHDSLNDLLEKEITVRGWLHHDNNKIRMTLRHPSAIRHTED